MAKNVREQVRTPKTARTDQPIIPPKYQHLAAIVLLYISLLVFFHAIVFNGKTYQSADSIAAHSWETLLNDAQSEGIFPLWNPYIFCGMPGYASLTFSMPRTHDITAFVFGKVRLALGYMFLEQKDGSWLLFYLIYGIGMYLFVFQKLKNKPVALIVACMAVYATRVALLIMIGHVTKIAVLAWFPYVFLLIEKLKERFNLLQAILLAILVRFMIEPGHVQFIFYIYLTIGAYLLFSLLRALFKKENWKGVIISGASLVFATIFAFLLGADQHLSTLEYNAYSMRGSNPIVHTSEASQTKTIEGGLDYDYATNWSFSPGEMMTFFIPSWYGFGDLPYQGPLTGNQLQTINFYLGPEISVDAPQYMGVLVVILAIIGFIRNRKDPFVLFMGGAVILSLLISFGREFSLVYDLMYRYFPMFNKFRVPVTILMLVQFFTPILAGYGIVSFLTDRPTTMNPAQEKKWKYILGGLGLCVGVSLIGGSFIKDLYSSFFPIQEIGKILSRSYNQLNPTVIGMFSDFIASTVVSDILVGCILLTIVFAAFYYYQKGKLKSPTLYGLIIAAVLFDLWRVASKPYEPRSQQESQQYTEIPGYAKFLLQDTTHYRVLKMINGQPVYDNTLAYWRIQNAYGYQGAKMRAYQDMADVAGLGNPLVWQMMNIKYILSNRDESTPMLEKVYESSGMKVYAFRAWMPRAFFVNRYEVSDSLSTLNKIAAMSFDTRDVAYIPKTMTAKIDSPGQGADARIVHYGIQDIELHVKATGNNLLFLSETYYPKGWKAFIDGKEVEILRLNYLFRGVVVPQGEHTMEMKFEPNSFILGRKISLASNIIVLAGIAIQGTLMVRRKKRVPVQQQSDGTK
jgi:hypothetical protein